LTNEIILLYGDPQESAIEDEAHHSHQIELSEPSHCKRKEDSGSDVSPLILGMENEISPRKKKRGSEEIFLISNTTTEDHLFQQLVRIGNTVLIDSIDDVDTGSIYFIRAVIFDVTHLVKDADISWIRRVFKKAFVVVHDPSAIENPQQRLRWFDAGSNMVSHDIESLVSTLSGVLSSGYNRDGIYTCPYCDFHTLTEDELRAHMPMYHINWPNTRDGIDCPICRQIIYKPFQVHMHEDHGAEARENRKIGLTPQNRAKLDAACLVVCWNPKLNSYLLAQTYGNEGLWLPGGFLERGEGFVRAAQRECLSQCNIHVEVKGYLGMSHLPNLPSGTASCSCFPPPPPHGL
jgi:ADP-ribose pyrophosphatase YjhB (NUDIX family)